MVNLPFSVTINFPIQSTKKDKKTFCHGLRPMVWIAAMVAWKQVLRPHVHNPYRTTCWQNLTKRTNFVLQKTFLFTKNWLSDSKSSFKPNTEEELVLIMLKRRWFGEAKGKLVFTMPSVKFLAEGKSHSADYRSTIDKLL